jgi:hypothetical protein
MASTGKVTGASAEKMILRRKPIEGAEAPGWRKKAKNQRRA